MRRLYRNLSLLLSTALLAGLLAVPASAADKPYIRQVEAGKWSSWAVTSTGDLYGWGATKTAELFPGGKTGSNVPVKLMSGVKSVAASSTALQDYVEVRDYDEYGYITNYQEPGTVLAIIKENGDLYTWGDNICYQLGKGYYEAEQTTYEPYFVMGNVVKAATNDHACAAVTENGDLYFWGYNLAHPNGTGEGGSALYAEPTVILTGVKDVELDGNSVMALKNDGSVWMMGTTLYGIMGWDDGLNAHLVNEMTKVMDGCVDIAVGFYFAMAVKNDGTLYGWGYNGFTALGIDDDISYTTTPVVIDTGVKSVDAGNHNAYYIKNDGSLWSIGDGGHGQRGIGNDIGYEDPEGGVSYAYPSYPTQVATDVHSVSGGSYHMFFLKNDGTMWGAGGAEGDHEGGARLGRGDVWGETVSFVDDGQTFTSHSAYQWHATQCGLSYGSFAGMFGPVQEEVELVAGFADIAANAWYRDAVEWAVDRGITSGTGDITFSPDRDCTRAEILTFLWRANGCPSADGDASFDDVAVNAYYADAAAWAAEEGIVLGDRLDPDAPCTRAMAVEFLWRAGGCQAIATDTGFTDVSISDSYSTAVEWAVIYGITSGTSETTFSPDLVCTRAQIVTFLYRSYAD